MLSRSRGRLALAAAATLLMAAAEAGPWLMRLPALATWWASWAIPAAAFGIAAVLLGRPGPAGIAAIVALALQALDDALIVGGVYLFSGWGSVYLYAVLAAAAAFALHGWTASGGARAAAWALALAAVTLAVLLQLGTSVPILPIRLASHVTWVGLPAWLAFDAWRGSRAGTPSAASAQSL